MSTREDFHWVNPNEPKKEIKKQNVHLSTIMPKDMEDLFMSEVVKSLNEITFNGQRKIVAVRKYGNSIAVTLEADKWFPKEAYQFSLATKLSEVVLDDVKKDSRCKKHGVVFDYINDKPVCPICGAVV